MAEWLAGSGISGIGPDGAAIANAAQWVPGTVATVDLNLPTRIQYVKPGLPLSGLVVTAKLRITKQEVANANAQGQRIASTMYIVPAAVLAQSGVTAPTPSEIIAWSRGSRGIIIRSSTILPTSISEDSRDVTFNFPTLAANRLTPGTKYWIAITPTWARLSDAKPDYDTTLGTSVMKALSFWTNRAPGAPVITSPAPGTSVAEGESFVLSATPAPADPDVIWPATSSPHRDWAGVHLQYAPVPTRQEPNPEWRDLTFASATSAVDPGYSFEGQPDGGLGWLRYLGSTQIRGGSNNTEAGQGILPSGSWQIRLRSFDFGHPLGVSTTPGPNSGPYTPATYPNANTSPWSNPVTVTVTARVPAPVPISPANGSAVQEGNLVTLAWQYRNTATPPSPQKARTVQMRLVGAPNWVTLVSGNSTGRTHTAQQSELTVEYINDGTFESGSPGLWTAATTTGSWENWVADPAVTAAVEAHPVYSGQKRLRVSGMSVPNSGVARDVWLMGHSLFTLQGTVQAGPTQNGRSATVQVSWFDTNDVLLRTDHVGSTDSYDAEPFSAVLRRPAGANKLTVQVFTPTVPGGNGFAVDDFILTGADPAPGPIPLEAGRQYEWRVRVTDATNVVSDYSPPARFWIVPAPAGGGGTPVLPSDTIEGATLGCGNNRAFIYRRGGEERLGEITGISSLDWARMRDDISTAKITVSAEGLTECEPLLKNLLPWAHEIVIFRENGNAVDRVWEGPVTLITHETNKVTIHAKDVVAYIYRRIIRLLMSDSRFGDTVVNRATRVIQHALSMDDPNVLQHLTPLQRSDDARQYRSTPPYSRTAFEEVDDMASNSGLDYAAVGRRIVLWGTKHRIGTLSEFRDGDLGSPPIVSMYGMSMANRYVVSDGNGVWGAADAEGAFNEDGIDPVYGLIEMLSSSWAADSDVDPSSVTAENIAKMIKSFEGFAERSVADKYPVPVVVRVPDNTALSPQAPVSIQHLVPGVVIPLRSTGTLHHVVASQKLDSVSVTQQEGTETITVTMSPFSRDDNATEAVEAE